MTIDSIIFISKVWMGDDRMLSSSALRYLHSKVTEILTVAKKYGGVVYGTYVRDVVTRILNNNDSPVAVDGVSIWFRCEEGRSLFMNEANFDFRLASKGFNIDGFFAHQFTLTAGRSRIPIDFVKNDEFPKFDLDVNHLTWDCETNVLTTYGDYDLDSVLSNIKNKRCVPTEKLLSLVNSIVWLDNIHPSNMRMRVYNMINDGWKFYTKEDNLIVFTTDVPLNPPIYNTPFTPVELTSYMFVPSLVLTKSEFEKYKSAAELYVRIGSIMCELYSR